MSSKKLPPFVGGMDESRLAAGFSRRKGATVITGSYDCLGILSGLDYRSLFVFATRVWFDGV